MLAPETVLQNRYRIVRKLGEGGMGMVYEAFDQRLKAAVAVKETIAESDRARRAFEHEASLLANLRHGSLPKVTDHFTEGDGQFLVMEFVAGDDLAKLLHERGRAFSPSEVLEWADQVLGALQYLHSHQPPILHRDIKPSNIKLDAQGRVILLDFGLAKGRLGQMSTMTSSRSITGYTPIYAPLEQIMGAGTDVRSDIYSLGATLYHLITGIIPTDAPTRFEALEEGRPDPLRAINEVNPEVTIEIADALKMAMAVSRRERFVNVWEMRAILQKARQSLPPSVNESATKGFQPSEALTPAPSIKTGNMETWPPAVPTLNNTGWEQTPNSPPPTTSPVAAPALTREQGTLSFGSGHAANLYAPSTPAIPRPETSRRTVGIVAGVIALIVAGIVVFVLLYNRSASPTKTIQAYFDAIKREDVEAFKKTLSKERLREEDERADKAGASVDDHLKKVLSSISSRIPAQIETRNEKIDGDRATVEVKSGNETWNTWNLIKEGGEWKVAGLGPT